MKKIFSDPRCIFILLMIVSMISIVAGIYLTVTLGMQIQAAVTALSAVGILLWVYAWCVFMAMCNRLRKGESAFTIITSRNLRSISYCMVGLSVITIASGVISAALQFTAPTDASYPDPLVTVAPVLLQCALAAIIFAGAALAARILRGLLNHAIALEAEQEGVI